MEDTTNDLTNTSDPVGTSTKVLFGSRRVVISVITGVSSGICTLFLFTVRRIMEKSRRVLLRQFSRGRI